MAPDGPCADDCEPAIVCTLSADAVPDRLAEWHDVLDLVVRREPIDNGLRLHLQRRDGLAAQVVSLAEREHECCAFFEFAVRIGATGVALEVSAPPEASTLVLELFG